MYNKKRIQNSSLIPLKLIMKGETKGYMETPICNTTMCFAKFKIGKTHLHKTEMKKSLAL